mgnify:CR=1 FL=1|tara:strand:- start:2279 stop:3499 length:1221 start_codon:yes stop_codon:yes gene_type:complete
MNKKPLKKSYIFQLLKTLKKIKLGDEILPLENSKGRFLSKSITSKINLPPFNNSAVDGYALVKNDIIKKNQKLKIIHRIAAGDKISKKLLNGSVARIFTGAKMPINSKTVIMQENVQKINDEILIKKIPKYGENCRLSGEDILKGKKILYKGERVTSNNINLIAAIGRKNVLVKKKINIGFFTNGNELIEPTENLRGSQINNSNFYSINDLLDEPYINKKYLGVLHDTEHLIKKSILNNILKFNVIITAGGASVGEEDHLIKIIQKVGKIYFWKTAIKPGRPLAIGKIKNTIIVCLPGNPVSVHLLYGMIIKPFIKYLCTGILVLPRGQKLKANFSMKKKNKRLEWIRVNIKEKNSNLIANKFSKQGSGMISSMAFSDGILEIPENVNFISKGDEFFYYSFKKLFE